MSVREEEEEGTSWRPGKPVGVFTLSALRASTPGSVVVASISTATVSPSAPPPPHSEGAINKRRAARREPIQVQVIISSLILYKRDNI